MILYGWGSATLFLQSFMLNAPDMTPITAVVLLGFGVVLITLGSVPLRRLKGFPWVVCLVIPALIVLTGLWTLAEYFIPGLPNIDLIFFREAVLQNGGRFPGRSSPHSAICFVGFGAPLFLMALKRRTPRWALGVTRATTGVGLGISLLVVGGYLTRVSALYELPGHSATGMSLMTAICFSLIGYSLIRLQRFRRPDRLRSECSGAAGRVAEG